MSKNDEPADASGYNLFCYCHNDPIDNIDPMGLQDTVATYSPRQTSQQREESLSASQAVWNRQMNYSSSFGAISYGMRAYAAEQAFKVSVGIEATKRAEAATGKGQVPYSVATLRYENSHTVAYGDPVPGIRDTNGGYREVIDTHHERFDD